ncbi:MAG: nucleotide exchange factor GrpE [Acidobacteria bacterium]|nr:nucleotide exchange factor GrpE [Acidobacteriota bacterium]
MTTENHIQETAVHEGVSDEVVEIEIVSPTAEALGLELPDDPDEARTALLNAVADARAEAGQNLEQLQRVAAEYENYRRRMERDRIDLASFATSRLVEQLLPALDSFEAALAYEPQTDREDKLLAGMTGTFTMLVDTLSSHGFEPIDAVGAPFDPSVHEAISAPTEGDGTLVVDNEVRRGYKVDGRVVRPALVTLSYGDVGEDSGEPDDA